MTVAAHHQELVRALILGDNRIIAQDFYHPMYAALFSGLRDLARKGGTVEQIAEGIGQNCLAASEWRWFDDDCSSSRQR